MTQRHVDSYEPPVILPSGDQAISVEFAAEISERVNGQVYALADALTASPPAWMNELVPAYRSLLVQYDAFQVDFDVVAAELRERVAAVYPATGARDHRQRTVYELPVAYGGENGPDLEAVASQARLSPEDVVRIHSGVNYRVYMIGFSPGFPYLGGMDERIACPRLATPRTRVPAGSVGIAESQTGVYPNASPGGWQLIGRTPVRLFDQSENPPSVLQPGHYVRFLPVDSDEMSRIEELVAGGEYVIKSTALSA
ncbi:MAG: 5-oxoprolinase subunit PxpB [Chloroflexi bacterium]|nr:5-oxoprolinase subunit PxpB [Chloroflexota bacterium]